MQKTQSIFYSRYSHQNVASISLQRGAVLYMVLGAILAVIAILALVVDLPQQEISAAEAKSAADAASLAAAGHLDGTSDGWRKAVAVARRNIETNLFVNNNFNRDVTEKTIELGFVGMTSDSNGEATDNHFHSFFEMSLEAPPSEECTDCDNYDFSGADNQLYYGAPQKTIANAIRISVRAGSRTASFGKILGFAQFSDVERSGVSLAYDQQEYCVAPLAIPACSLFLDSNTDNFDPYGADDYRIDDFDPLTQSGRELIFTEASPWKPWTMAKRAYGLNRHLTYHLPPKIHFTNVPGFPGGGANECGVPEDSDPDKKHPNCRADPIYGVLGMPGTHPSDSDALSPTELADAFEEFSSDWVKGQPDISNCSVKARFGAPFRPLENAVDDQFGLLSNETLVDGDPNLGFEPPKKKIERALDRLMPMDSKWNFANTFFDEKGVAQANIPLTRTSIDDLTLRWPPYDKVSTTTIDEGVYSTDNPKTSLDERTFTRLVLAQQMGDYQHIKPLAHSPYRPVLPMSRHGVKEVLAMVIGPAGNDPYCDFSGYIGQRTQINTTPHHYSSPRIIGFVKVILVDYNFSLYKRSGSEERAILDTIGSSPIAPDRNPIGIAVPNDAVGVDAPEHDPSNQIDPWNNMFGEGEGDGGEYQYEPTPTPNPMASPTPTPTPLVTAAPSVLFDLNSIFEYPIGSGNKYRPKNLGIHPLPLRRENCEDPFFDGHCHYLQNHPVQYGLGGITAALSIELPMPLFGPRPVAGASHPILVAVKEPAPVGTP